MHQEEAGANKLLRSLERYTKTDMVYLTHSGFWLFLKRILSSLIAVSLAIALANLLNPTTYGEYKYVFSIFALLTIPTLLGMGDAATKAVAQGFEGTVIPALKTKILWGTIGSAGSVAVAIYYYLAGNIELAGAFAVVAVFLPFVDTLGIFNSVLTGKRLFKVSILYEVASQGISAMIIISTLFFTNNLVIILISYFLAYTLMRFIVFRIVTKRYIENNNVEPTALSYGKHLSIMRIVSTISEAIDSILLWQFIGPAQLAIYAFAKAVPVQIRETLGVIPKLAFPKFAQRNFSEIRENLPGRMFLMFLIVLSITAVYFFIAPFIYQTLFPQYTESIFYSQLFAITLLFFPQKFIGAALSAHAKTKALYTLSFIVPTVKTISAIALIPTFGIMGAIIAELIGRITNFLLLSFLLFKIRT